MDQLANETFPADEFLQVMDLTDPDQEEGKLAACQRLVFVMAHNRPPRKKFPQYIAGIITGFRTTKSNTLKVRLLQLLVLLVPRHKIGYFGEYYDYNDYGDDGPDDSFWLGLLSTMQEETHYLVDPNAVNIMAAFWFKYPEEVKELMTKHEYYDFNNLVLIKIGSDYFTRGDEDEVCSGFGGLLRAHVGDGEREIAQWVYEHYEDLHDTLAEYLWRAKKVAFHKFASLEEDNQR